MTFVLTGKQREVATWLSGPERHFMLFGGSRSGKTFYLVRATVIRGLKTAGSRHAILRQTFNAVKNSIVVDTFPKVMELCFPDTNYHLNKSDWYVTLPNGSEIWFGGFGDNVEKILGQEYATIYLNECSEIPYANRNLAVTRIAQKVEGIQNKMLYDCNPPSTSHWTYKLFIKKEDPASRGPLPDPDSYTSMRVNPIDNKENIDAAYLQELQNLPKRMRDRFWSGQWADATEYALWLPETLDRYRVTSGELPEMRRVIVGVDPSGSKVEDADKRSDEVGIIVAGLGVNGDCYVLEDLSGRYSPAGEEGWGNMAVEAYKRHSANRIVAEKNFGGAMVEAVIKANDRTVPVHMVTATRGKEVRADPIAELYAQGKVHHVDHMTELEDQMLSMTSHGYEGDGSPDRLDAAVWAISDLFPKLTKPKRTTTLQHQGASGHSALGW